MSNVKSYIIDYDWKAGMVVEIDHDVMTDKELHSINNFWGGSESRLERHGLVNAVLTMLAQLVIPQAYAEGFNTRGVVAMFDWDDGEGQEGWPPMDGSQGIKIVSIETNELFDEDDFTVKPAA